MVAGFCVMVEADHCAGGYIPGYHGRENRGKHWASKGNCLTKFYELLIGKFSFYTRLASLATGLYLPDLSNNFCAG